MLGKAKHNKQTKTCALFHIHAFLHRYILQNFADTSMICLLWKHKAAPKSFTISIEEMFK